MDDLSIIELYFERDENAIKETDIKYKKLCLGIARNILNNEADSEECVNDTYLSLWNSIPPARPDNFSAFICRITRNLSLKRLGYNRAQKRNPSVTVSFEELESVLPDSLIEPDISDEKLGKVISDFLRNQKEEARNVFIRKYWYFDTVADIAARYSFSESKVKVLLHRTRNKLREHLKKEGIYL